MQVLVFILLLCFVCGFLLAVASYTLSDKQKAAREFDQSKQMLISAKILDHRGFFQLMQEDGTLQPAIYDTEQKILVPDTTGGKPKQATAEEIDDLADSRIRPLLTDRAGKIYTLEEKNINLETYLEENKKTGYAQAKWQLFYAILANEAKSKEITAQDLTKDITKGSIFVFPVSGFGLWGPIYGYIAIGKDGDHVVGTTWYEHAETPGLGANITESWWQNLFYNKVIFQETAGGKTDFATAPMGIIVVKGKVKDVYGSSPKANSAVDGMSGATLTGDGVTAAYRESLTPYRQLLLNIAKGVQK